MLPKHKENKGRKVSKAAHLFFIPLLLLLFWTSTSFASTPPIERKLIIAYQEVLKLKLEEGRKRLVNSEFSTDNLPLRIYTENMADMLELLLTEDKTLYEQKKDHEKKRLAALEELSASNPYKLFCAAEIKLQWAFVKLKFGDELSAVWNLNQAYKTILLNAESFPDFEPNKKTLGLFNILFGAVPQQYHWLLNLLGIKGSTTIGLQQLTDLAHSEHLFSFESRLLIGLINMYLMGNPEEAITSVHTMAREASGNKLLQYLYVIMLIKNNQAEEAFKILEAAEKLNEGYLPLAMIHYLRGEVCLQKGLYEAASENYLQFLSYYKGENFVKDAYYKLFLTYWLAGDDRRAKSYFAQAKQRGIANAEADKYAAKQLAQDTYPEKTILKIRLATDGGYYRKAQTLVDQHTAADFASFQDKVEFTYRKARLYHKQNRTEEAIWYYIQTIDQSGNKPWYFAPNAALQLGYIYVEQGNEPAARKYFQKTLTYKDHEYKNSIDNKAKIALEGLR